MFKFNDKNTRPVSFLENFKFCCKQNTAFSNPFCNSSSTFLNLGPNISKHLCKCCVITSEFGNLNGIFTAENNEFKPLSDTFLY